MKKLIIAILLLCAITILASCDNALTEETTAETPETTLAPETTPAHESNSLVNLIPDSEYTALHYDMSAGSISDSSTPMYTGKKFGKKEEYKKSETEIEKKRETSFFGKQKTVWYGHTWKYDELGYEVDKYSFQNDGETLFISYNSSTGKPVRYVSRPANNRSYSSPVNPDSTEAEYVAYAKQILLEYAGVSAEGWDYDIVTWREEYGNYNYFINYSHEIPEYNAVYTITFSKKISGIDRIDKMHVKLTNVGEIEEFQAINYDEAFKPFENVKIDREKVEAAAMRAAYSPSGGSITKLYTQLFVSEGCLWAQVEIDYSLVDGIRGGTTYAIKVAELAETKN